MNDSTLKELWQQVAEKKSCEAKQKELTAQRDTLADRLKKLEKSKLAEQADVDRLEGHGCPIAKGSIKLLFPKKSKASKHLPILPHSRLRKAKAALPH